MFAARPRHRHLGGDRRRVDQAVRLHAVHARPGRRRPLPADRPVATCRGRCEQHLGHTFRFVELANDVNEHMPDYVVRRVIAGLNNRSQVGARSRILLLGLAYKKSTGDARETPVRRIAELLVELGAGLFIVDPHVAETRTPPGTKRIEGAPRELMAADAVLILVDHDEFDYGLLPGLDAYVLDCRRATPPGAVELL